MEYLIRKRWTLLPYLTDAREVEIETTGTRRSLAGGMKKCSGVLFILTLAVVLFLLSPSPSPTPPPNTAPNGPITDLLPTLPGLSDLYPPAPNSTAHLSWGLLRPLLCRSDALPGTSAGVLEAAEAWRNLTLAVTAAASEEEARLQGLRCSSSVGGDLRTGRATLPCGLSEGAALTVVGILREGAAKFWVEMLGANGEVVLHVNVSLGAAGVVVEQNSWTPEEGWGEWERCPPVGDVGSSNSSLQLRLAVLLYFDDMHVWQGFKF